MIRYEICPKNKNAVDIFDDYELLFCENNKKDLPQSTKWSHTQHG